MSSAAVAPKLGATRLLERLGRVGCLDVLQEAYGRAEANRFNRDSVALRRRLERRFRAPLERELVGLGGRVASATADAGGLVVARQEAAVEPTRAETARINAILRLSDLEGWRQDSIKPWIDKLYESAFLGTYSIAQTTLTKTERDKAVERILKEGGRRLGMIDIADDTKQALFRVLEFSRNWEAGQPSPRQVAKWIQKEVPAGRFVNAGSRYRSQLIARTEIMHSTRKAQIETFRADSRVDMVVAFDGDEDPDCAARNGTEFTLADADIEIGAEHPNGTLSFAPVYRRS